jgi:uncharacterized Zn-binding protein involved in type VI secretion
MAGEIIRLGDPTTHGGKVIEGSPVDICHGKPIAYLGHKAYCPQCKGTFPIIEGAPTTTFYGKGVALAGMKTACGALLIATQITDIVETGGGTRPGAAGVENWPSDAAASVLKPGKSMPPTSLTERAGATNLEQYFEAVDSTGAVVDLVYRIDSGSTKVIEATLSSTGTTEALPVDVDVQLIFWKRP